MMGDWVKNLVETDTVDEYFDARSQLAKLFEYEDANHIAPFEDGREFYWCVSSGCLYYSYSEDVMKKVALGEAEDMPVEDVGEYYEALLYHDEYHQKAIFEGEAFTLVRADIQSDGNIVTFVMYKGRQVKLHDK